MKKWWIRKRSWLCGLLILGILICCPGIGAQELRGVLPEADSAIRITIHPGWADAKGYFHIYGVNLWKPVDTEQMQLPTGYPVYCIEPAISVTPDNSAYVDQNDLMGAMTNTALPEPGQVKEMIGRVLHAGFLHPEGTNWYEDDTQIAAYLATKLLVWECIEGNRDAAFVSTAAANPLKAYFVANLPIWSQPPVGGSSVQEWYCQIEERVQKSLKRVSFAAEDKETAPLYEMHDSLILEEDEEILSCFEFWPDDESVVLKREEGKLIIENPDRVNEFTITVQNRFAESYAAPGALLVYDTSSGTIGEKAQTVCGPTLITIAGKEKQYFRVEQKITTHLRVEKRDPAIEGGLPGAHLKLLNEKGEEVAAWISTEAPYEIEGLAPGQYQLIETEAPVGYYEAESITFELAETEEEQCILLENHPTQITIDKTDAEGNPLAGAELEIQTDDGETVECWSSEEIEKVIQRLPMGRYICKENKAPAGYVSAAPVFFEIQQGKEPERIEIVNHPIQIEITKKDQETGKPVAGAHLELRDANGHVVQSWISEEEPFSWSAVPAGSYQLIEIKAPEGYEQAEPQWITVEEQTELQSFVLWNQRKPDEKPSKPEKPKEEPPKPQKPQPENPKTGDESAVIFYGLCGGISVLFLAGMGVIQLKNKKKEQMLDELK